MLYQKKLAKIKKSLNNLLFPFFCLNCGKEGRPICFACQKKVRLLPFQVCPVCEKNLSPQGMPCSSCQEKNFPLDSLLIASDYQDPKIAKSIHLLKYNFIQDLVPFLGKILVEALIKNHFPLPDYLIPVPLYPQRLRWRGFNQSELLANYISQKLLPNIKIPVKNDWLIRKKNTQSQMKITSAKKRKANLEKAFSLNFPDCFEGKNKRILLIDDVCTTGSTLVECAKTLRQIKPKSLSALVIGRQK